MSRTGGRILTIPPGVPFLRTLARSLADGSLVPGFRQNPADPASLADATIYVPTRRAARALRSEFVDLGPAATAILPVIRPLGEIDEDAGFFDEIGPTSLDLAPPVDPLRRTVELSALVMAWKAALEGRRPMAFEDPAGAVHLARELARLIDALETEGVAAEAIERLDLSDHAAWWSLTRDFLAIVTRAWPERLAELKRSDPAAHRNALLEAERLRFASAPPAGPVVIAGSTGSVPATAALMAAVARLVNGAVVLPGLDLQMAEEDWRRLAAPAAGTLSGAFDPAVYGHPQYGLAELLRRLQISREMVEPLAVADPVLARRNAFVSMALLPAEATARWTQASSRQENRDAFDDIALIEAANEREEAASLAVAIRLALSESPEAEVALVTPDRALARRVAAELGAFGLDIDDSGGLPLQATQPGTLLALVLDVALQPGDPVAILSLLKHPLTRLSTGDPERRLAVATIELLGLRGGTGTAEVDEFASTYRVRAEKARGDRHAPEQVRRISGDDIVAGERLAGALQAALDPLIRLSGPREKASAPRENPSPGTWARATAAALEAVAAPQGGDSPGLWEDEAGAALAGLLTGLDASAAPFGLDHGGWRQFLLALVAGSTVRPSGARHPRAFLWGALEARLQSVDTVILAGLNEGTWPGQAREDPFLSRPMKLDLGLDPPERRIGQAAHDFQMAIGTRQTILSRALRAEGAPTVASRWVQRLLAVAGEPTAAAMRARGDTLIAWADARLESAPKPPATRPEPKPPADSQPKHFTFSEVKTLRRDPYAVYARRVLRLDPLADLLRDPSFIERGTLYHAMLEEAVRRDIRFSDADAPARLQAIAEKLFAEERLPPHVAAVWRPAWTRIANNVVAWERSEDPSIRRRIVEARGRLAIPSLGISLGGRADRIDLLADGGARLIDYKSGSNPSVQVARALLDPQLPLEAAVLAAGGFSDMGALEPASLAYIRLRARDGLEVELLEKQARGSEPGVTPAELAAEALEKFSGLVAVLLSGKRGYASQLVPMSARSFRGDYDHLARVAEWSTSEDAGAEGGDG